MACWGRQAALEPPWRCFPGRSGRPRLPDGDRANCDGFIHRLRLSGG